MNRTQTQKLRLCCRSRCHLCTKKMLLLTPKRLVVYVDVEDGDDGDEENVSQRFVLSSLSGCGPLGKPNNFCTLPTKTAVVVLTDVLCLWAYSRHIKCDLSVLEENCFAGSLFSQGFTLISSFGSYAETLGDSCQNIYFPRHTLPLAT